MKVQFNLDYKLRPSGIRFSKFLLRYVKNDFRVAFVDKRVRFRFELLLESNWITWSNNFKKPSIRQIQKFILDAIQYRRIRNTYIIDINPTIMLPGTDVTIYSIVRFINYGNDAVKGCYLFSRIFDKYQKNIINYWRAYFIRSQFR